MFGQGEIQRALTRLGEIAWGTQRIIDMAGSAIVLAWGFRVATKDVDAVVRGDPSFLRRAVRQAVEQRDGPKLHSVSKRSATTCPKMRVIKQAASRHDRPRSLHEVAERTRAGQSFDPGLRAFLDDFYSHPERRQDMISDEPGAVGVVRDAYLAAVAEHLAECWRVRCPDWIHGVRRFLQRPFFAVGLEDLKTTLLVESPVAFRRRMLFVGRGVLDRPRRFSAAADR